VQGYDIDANAKVPLGAYGRLNVDFNATYYDKMLWKIGGNDIPYISGLGNFYAFEAPRFKAAGSRARGIGAPSPSSGATTSPADGTSASRPSS
jgi:hypothetical protein